jgi:hypothetical protein
MGKFSLFERYWWLRTLNRRPISLISTEQNITSLTCNHTVPTMLDTHQKAGEVFRPEHLELEMGF